MSAASISTPPLLQVEGLVKQFDGVKAVNGLSFSIQGPNLGRDGVKTAGECVALIGPNGAGKSTCFACISGQHVPTAGRVLLNGQSMAHWSPARRLQAGVARTFQVAQTFEALTTLQNLQLLTHIPRKLSAYKPLNSVKIDFCMALLAQVGLQHLAHAEVADLPYGAKKRLELAMALVGLQSQGSTPGHKTGVQTSLQTSVQTSLLLLDEPAAGLGSSERADLMRLVKSLCAQGISVLYTEHNMDAVFGVADRVLVLMDGQIAAQGHPDEIAQNALVQQRYLGQSGFAGKGFAAKGLARA